MSKRPSLFQATERQDVPRTSPAIAAEVAAAPATAVGRPSSRQGKKVLSVFLEPEAWRQLRAMALEENTTTQALGVEAVNMLFAARGKGRLA